MHYWLMKSEPDEYSLDDLIHADAKTCAWEGVRNYQARNFLRDQMKKNDLAFFYHSSCPTPGIVGIVEIIKEAYPDPLAFDKQSKYYDPQSAESAPRWFAVDVHFVCRLNRIITLQELRENAALKDMTLLKKGNRLSVMPITEKHWACIYFTSL